VHVIKRLMVDYDIPRQYLNFVWTDFLYLASCDLQSRVLSVEQQSRMELIFFIIVLYMGNSIVRDVTFGRIALMICDVISVIQQFTVTSMTVQGAFLSS